MSPPNDDERERSQGKRVNDTDPSSAPTQETRHATDSYAFLPTNLPNRDAVEDVFRAMKVAQDEPWAPTPGFVASSEGADYAAYQAQHAPPARHATPSPAAAAVILNVTEPLPGEADAAVTQLDLATIVERATAAHEPAGLALPARSANVTTHRLDRAAPPVVAGLPSRHNRAIWIGGLIFAAMMVALLVGLAVRAPRDEVPVVATMNTLSAGPPGAVRAPSTQPLVVPSEALVASAVPEASAVTPVASAEPPATARLAAPAAPQPSTRLRPRPPASTAPPAPPPPPPPEPKREPPPKNDFVW